MNLEHVKHVCDGDNCRDYGSNCQFCDGGLFLCTVCDGFEGAMTTHCYGSVVEQYIWDAVYDGRLDFKDGEWIPHCSFSCSSHYGMVPPEEYPK